MTDEETSLARLLVALPGYRPRTGMTYYDPDGTAWVVYAVMDGLPIGARLGDLRARAATSALPSGSIPWITDDGTAGILLGMLPPRHQATRDEGVYEVTVYDCPPLAGAVVHSGPHGTAKWWTVSGDSLGVAVARALVAMGRAA